MTDCSGIVVLRNNPQYELCEMCGGTGWAMFMYETPRYAGPTMIQNGGYMACRCEFGKLVATEEKGK